MIEKITVFEESYGRFKSARRTDNKILADGTLHEYEGVFSVYKLVISLEWLTK